jgi:serine/threonine protein kinase
MLQMIQAFDHSGQAPEGFPVESDTLGEFRLIREMGRGGMGVVYEAKQLSLGRIVAVKVLPSTAGVDTKQLAWFQIETQIAATLHHPHIVPIFAVGCERGLHYYAMQLIEGYCLGATLYELLTAQPVFNASDRHELIRHTAGAEPVAPCKLDSAIPRDLETICLKAMAKEPE